MDVVANRGLERFPRLFQTFALGGHVSKNRLAALAHGTGMVRDGLVMDDDVAYWGELAASDIGRESTDVSPTVSVVNNVPGESIGGLPARLGRAGKWAIASHRVTCQARSMKATVLAAASSGATA